MRHPNPRPHPHSSGTGSPPRLRPLPPLAALTTVFILCLTLSAAGQVAAAPAGTPAEALVVGFTDVLSGPERQQGLDRLAAVEEAARRYGLYHPDAEIEVQAVDVRAGNVVARLGRTDVVVAGRGSTLDDLVASGEIALTGEVEAFVPASPAGLLDTLTAFVPGSAGLVVTGRSADQLSADEFLPAILVDVEPLTARPGDTLTLTIEHGGFQRNGFARVRFEGADGFLDEPLVDLFSFGLQGYKVHVPEGATSGPVTLEIGSIGSPAVSRILVSPTPVIVTGHPPASETGSRAGASSVRDAGPGGEASSSALTSVTAATSALVAAADAAVNAPQACDITFRRLGSPNFFSETADTKDVVVADFENDGRLDVYVPETLLANPPPDDVEYKNLGNDSSGLPDFATITSGLFTNDPAPGNKRQYGADAADIDGDGDIDIIPSGSSAQTTAERVRILINNGNLTFTNEAQTRISNFADVTTDGHSWDEVDIADVDRDGDLDVALANRAYPPLEPSNAPSALLINDGGGFFTAYPSAFGEPASEVHHDAKWCDVNGDGYPDILLSQDIRGAQSPLRLHINDGNGSPPTFTDVTGTGFDSNPAAHSTHVGCRDFNRDGRMDLHAGLWASTLGSSPQDFVWLNASTDSNGNGTIEASEVFFNRIPDPDPASPAGEGFKTQDYAAAYGDFNGDGWVDIILSGRVTPKGPFLMCNNGDGTFTNASPTSGYWRDLSNTAFDHFVPTGIDVGDFNRDGRLDIVFGLGDGLNVASDEPNRIYVQNPPPPSGGGGGGSCLKSFETQLQEEPCLEVDQAQSESFELASVSEGDFVISPLASLCRNAMECPACGDAFLPCERFYNLIFDFAAAGLDLRSAELRLYDFGGKLLAVSKNRGGDKVLSFRPERDFRQGGLDQELYVALKAAQGFGQVSIPVRLEVSDRPIVP